MKKKLLYVFVLSCSPLNIASESSLNHVASWFSSSTEKTYNKTIPIFADSSLTINNSQGTVNIYTWSEPKIVLDVVITAREKELEHVHVQIEEDTKTKAITVHTLGTDTKTKATARYEIMVPEHIPLTITTHVGDIKVKNSKGVVTTKTGDGKITILDARNSVFAYTSNGAIDITCKRLPLECTLQIESERGNIAVGLPPFSHANIAAKTLNGTVTTDQEVMLKPQQVQLGPDAWKQFRQQAFCTLGNGGTAISLFTKNGNIKITDI